MDPAHLIDTASHLRGIEHHRVHPFSMSKTDVVRPFRPDAHQQPVIITQPWIGNHQEHPQSTKNPALESQWVLQPVRPDALPDSIVDARSPVSIIGVSTRNANRIVCRGQQ